MTNRTKYCKGCDTTKPLDLEHWHHAPSKGWYFRCRPCKKARDRERDRTGTRGRVKNRVLTEATRVAGDKPCGTCASLPHRVEGLRCGDCGLTWAAEPPVRLADFIYQQPWRIVG